MLDVFGPYLTKYKGEGKIFFNGKERFFHKFDCVQLPDGRILWHGYTDTVQEYDFDDIFSGKTNVDRLEGLCHDSTTLVSEGKLLMVKSNSSINNNSTDINKLFIIPSLHVRYTKPQDHQPKNIRFYITNLNFMGNPSALEIDLPDIKFNIYRIENYNEIIENIESTRLCNVTSIIEINLDNLSVDDTIGIANDICLLLSFASGTFIQWINYELISKTEEILMKVHRNSITTNYSQLRLIDHRNPMDLKGFLESTYTKFQSLKLIYPLENSIRAIVNAKLDGSFIELRSLILGSTTDVIVGHWATENNFQNLIEKGSFNKGLKDFKKGIEKLAIQVFNVNKAIGAKIANHASGMYRRSFRNKLEEMISTLDANITKKEISDFINSRNELTHRGKFCTSDPPNEFYSIVSFVDRLLLSLLGYQGPYLDCRTWERVE